MKVIKRLPTGNVSTFNQGALFGLSFLLPACDVDALADWLLYTRCKDLPLLDMNESEAMQ